MRFTTFIALFIISLSAVLAQHKNVPVFPSNKGPNEPSIAIDPKNPRHIIAGSNIDLYAVSENGGQTWSVNHLKSTLGVWGDPVIIVDTNSHFYFFHLSSRPGNTWLDRIICQKTTNLGVLWNDGSYSEPEGKQHDKEWAVVDRTNNNIYMTWTVFDKYGSKNPKDSSNILFAKSIDGGLSWTKPIRINDRAGDCIDSDSTVEGAVPCVGPNGEIFVVWSGHEKLYFDKSTDQGESWLEKDMIIGEQYGGWNYKIPGIYRCNGLPIIDCDLSESEHKGTIYINYTDQKYGVEDTDVWLMKSTDAGESWSGPIRVNDDKPGKQQFLTWMTIDQTNGYLYFVFYDRRNHPDNATDVFMAVSKDGGATFENFKISEKPFIPTATVFFGDYNNIAAVNGTIRPIWTRMDGAKKSVLTAIINTDSIGVDVEETVSIYTDFNPILYQNYPNPFSGSTYLSFRLWKTETVDLLIYNSRGQEVCHIIKNKKYAPGKYIESINARQLNLISGVYYYVLRTLNGTISKKMITIK